MSEIEVAEGATALGLRYNQQSTNPSMYQKRLTSYLYPSQNAVIDSSTNSNKTIKFLVSSNFFLDGRNSYLRLQAQISGTNSNNLTAAGVAQAPWNRAVFTSNTETWIKKLTIYTNMGVVIEQITDYNVLGALMKVGIEEAYANSVGLESLNMVDNLTCEARQALASQYKTYVIELNGSGFLKAFNYLPLHALAGNNSNSFQIEIEFGAPSDLIIAWKADGSNGNPFTAQVNPKIPTMYNVQVANALPVTNDAVTSGALSYQFRNIVYVQSLVQDDLMEASLMETIKSVPLMLHYETFRHYSNQISGTAGGNVTLSISEFQESIRDLQSVFRYQSLLSSQAVDSTSFVFPNMTQYQLQIGPIYYPSQPLLTSFNNLGQIPDLGEQYYEYTKDQQKAGFFYKGFRSGNDAQSTITQSNNYWITPKGNTEFVLTNDLRPFPDYSIGDPDFEQYITGVNTKASPQPLQLLLGVVAQDPVPGGNGVVCDSYSHYDAYCVIQSNEVYIIS